MNLLLKAFIRSVCGMVCLGLLLFWPAGTFDYPGAWLLMGLLFVPMLLLGVMMYVKSPALLEKRLHSKEGNKEQKIVILLSSLLFLSVFLLCGLDFRFGWSQLPSWVVTAAATVFLMGYGLYVEVIRENAYLSRTVEVQEGQTVVDTGLYALVRHPMYFATLLLFFSMPLVLGSLYACLLMPVGYLPIIAWRIRDEERTLLAGLPGYDAYREKVKYRMIPFLW